jgi:hypothetical protein
MAYTIEINYYTIIVKLKTYQCRPLLKNVNETLYSNNQNLERQKYQTVRTVPKSKNKIPKLAKQFQILIEKS